MLQCADARLSAPWDLKAEVTQANGFPTDEGNRELKEKLQAFWEQIPALVHEGHTGEIEDVLNALETGERPLITSEDGRRTVEVITAIYKAGFTGQQVKLPISGEDEYYTFEGILKNAPHFYEKKNSVENFAEEKFRV